LAAHYVVRIHHFNRFPYQRTTPPWDISPFSAAPTYYVWKAKPCRKELVTGCTAVIRQKLLSILEFYVDERKLIRNLTKSMEQVVLFEKPIIAWLVKKFFAFMELTGS
jgi:hypothetical protein